MHGLHKRGIRTQKPNQYGGDDQGFWFVTGLHVVLQVRLEGLH